MPAQPVPAAALVTPESVRDEVAALVLDRAHAYAVQGDDDRLPRVRAFDIDRAAARGAEYAAVVLNHENQLADPVCRPVRSETSDRYNVRFGNQVSGLDALFAAKVADAREQGEDPRKAVAKLAQLLEHYVADSARHALKGNR